MPKFQTNIQGIPCEVEFAYYPSCRGARERGTGVPLEPDMDASCELLEVYDRRGYLAPWLSRKLTHADIRRIEAEALEYWQNQREDHSPDY